MTTGTKKEKIVLGKFVWNFGDGMTKEETVSDIFSYTYQYPGDYVLSLSYYNSILDSKPETTDRITIKVIPSGIVISSIGSYTDPYIEIENKSNYEMSLNDWILTGSIHTFVFPNEMVILPNKKLKLSPYITGFDFNDLNKISIIDKTGQVFATYPNKNQSTVKYSSNKNSSVSNIINDLPETSQIKNIEDTSNIINLNDLNTNTKNVTNTINYQTIIYLILAGIIVLGIVSVYMIRRKEEYPDNIDMELSAKDMTIVE